MRLGALFSGGKDSTYAIYLAKKAGHRIECLISMWPGADDSLLFHYPNSAMTEYLAEAMQTPLVSVPAPGRSKEEEAEALDLAVSEAKKRYRIEGIVHGGIASNFQKQAFEAVCKKHNLKVFAPLWGVDQEKYMRELLDSNFSVMIVGISAMGLEKEWLGRMIDRESLARLSALSRKHGFNLAFEGGEAETLVLDCPLYSKRLSVRKARTHWDGQRGIFEILDAELVHRDV
ncbi:diphthine--ammonia ligase [Nitrososphaera sp.]|uniref:diphthine--ammonia ligase n=1 Tax=Nitrososphaera sp. TaxID=1971748 RepID=UPI0017ADEAB9|nr:diphthine--ammonia ligase [Nitrososphaera sp.]NWG38336.1 diphthine--ammonia ligase [Nitrososphaera sp.]